MICYSDTDHHQRYVVHVLWYMYDVCAWCLKVFYETMKMICEKMIIFQSDATEYQVM